MLGRRRGARCRRRCTRGRRGGTRWSRGWRVIVVVEPVTGRSRGRCRLGGRRRRAWRRFGDWRLRLDGRRHERRRCRLAWRRRSGRLGCGRPRGSRHLRFRDWSGRLRRTDGLERRRRGSNVHRGLARPVGRLEQPDSLLPAGIALERGAGALHRVATIAANEILHRSLNVSFRPLSRRPDSLRGRETMSRRPSADFIRPPQESQLTTHCGCISRYLPPSGKEGCGNTPKRMLVAWSAER
jgi:hypothetical protein